MNKIDKHKLIILIAVLVVLLMVGGSCIAAPIPSDVKTVVAFIFVENQKGELIPNGTSFFVSVQNPSVPATHATYLVTAKHVLCKPDSTEFYARIFVRLNRKQGGADIGPIAINPVGDNKNVFVHNDPSVDIAVIPFMADQSKYEFRFLPADMITTKEAFKQMKIREGADVFFTGLFAPFPGSVQSGT